MAKARRQGKLRGRQPELPPSAARAIRRRYADGEVSLADLAEECSVGRSTIHRIIHRPQPDTAAAMRLRISFADTSCGHPIRFDSDLLEPAVDGQLGSGDEAALW
jgi:CTP:molybdopterin cytidylyltransferase MocA